MAGDAGLGIDRIVVLIMGAARGIEAAGEDEAGFGLRFGGVDLKAAEGEVGGFGHLRGGLCASDRGQAVLQAGEDAAALVAAAAHEVECAGDDRDHRQHTAADHQK